MFGVYNFDIKQSKYLNRSFFKSKTTNFFTFTDCLFVQFTIDTMSSGTTIDFEEFVGSPSNLIVHYINGKTFYVHRDIMSCQSSLIKTKLQNVCSSDQINSLYLEAPISGCDQIYEIYFKIIYSQSVDNITITFEDWSNLFVIERFMGSRLVISQYKLWYNTSDVRSIMMKNDSVDDPYLFSTLRCLLLLKETDVANKLFELYKTVYQIHRRMNGVVSKQLYQIVGNGVELKTERLIEIALDRGLELRQIFN